MWCLPFLSLAHENSRVLKRTSARVVPKSLGRFANLAANFLAILPAAACGSVHFKRSQLWLDLSSLRAPDMQMGKAILSDPLSEELTAMLRAICLCRAAAHTISPAALIGSPVLFMYLGTSDNLGGRACMLPLMCLSRAQFRAVRRGAHPKTAHTKMIL